MKILKSLKDLAVIVKNLKKNNKKVGLIVGGFDVLHMGHINLFRLAKKNVDVLVVGLDNDKTLKNIKGSNRPINNYLRRSNFLSELTLVDYVFKINKVFKRDDVSSSEYFFIKIKKIGPTHVFTHSKTDSFVNTRINMAKKLGIKFMPDTSKTVTHSSVIISKLESEL